jgi:ADP-heptose:LPS heptosyltransferase
LKKILVIRFSSIGDIVLTSPVLRALKLQLGAEVHFLTKSEYAPLVSANPYVDRIHAIEKDLSEIIETLKSEEYDFIADLHHNLRTAKVKRALRKPSASLDKLNVRKWLLVYLKKNLLPDIHVAERCLNVVKSLGVTDDGKGLDFFIPPASEVDVSSMPALRKGYIGFAIGAQHYTKRLPVEKIASICKQAGQTIVLLGGKEDASVGEEVCRIAGTHVINACGKYSLLESASLVRQASKIITHDTGLMHIAAAYKKEIISVWGNTVPAFGMYPYRSGHGEKGAGTIVEVGPLSCRPCSKIGFDKCPKGHFKCMRQIDERIILDAINTHA